MDDDSRDIDEDELNALDTPRSSVSTAEGPKNAVAGGVEVDTSEGPGKGGEGSGANERGRAPGRAAAAGARGGVAGGKDASGGAERASGNRAGAGFGAGGGRAAARAAPARVPNTALQRKMAAKMSAGKRALYYKHAQGHELAATFMNNTGTVLQETSQQIQEISNAMRYLQGNLWELAATGTTPWQRVPNNVHIPPDVYEKHRLLRAD